MKTEIISLNKQEFSNLSQKVNNNSLVTDYFRKNLFNATIKNSVILKRKKVIYDNGKDIIIKVNKSLNQRHRDLFTTLMYQPKSDIKSNGSFEIKTSIYRLAKKIYPNSKNAKHRVKQLLEDMRSTLIDIKINNIVYSHTLLGDSVYDEIEDTYVIQIPPKTAKYMIYSTGVSIPKEINRKIIAIPNKYAKTKALVSYLLSNNAKNLTSL